MTLDHFVPPSKKNWPQPTPTIYLEECVMVNVLADVVEVVVFTPCSDALLGVHNPRYIDR